ncbi:MAG: hypothetical protein ACI9XR_002732, partial [Flavobacterium sp.]
QSKEMNIKVKLTGFKKAYNIDDSEPFKNTVTIEQKYDVLKRKVVSIEKENN